MKGCDYMEQDDIMCIRTLTNQFYTITETMCEEISSGSICSDDMEKYTDMIKYICATIQTVYAERS